MILNDAIIPFHPKDKATVDICCNSLRDIMGIKNIFLITSEDPKIANTNFINEKEITSIVSFNEIKTKWETTGSIFANRAGWIYQQLLKLGASQLLPDLSTDFLISDSDIIWLNNPYLHIENGIFPYSKAYSGEYNEPYRKNYERLLKEPTESGFSFINHNMVLNKDNIQNLKKMIEDKNNERWDHAIISSLDFHSFSDFSEYDLYGNWMFKYKKNIMQKVDIRIKDIRVVPNDTEIYLGKTSGYHILSSQAWNR